jgi:hypothetical protein
MKKPIYWIILGGLLVALVALRALASSSETTAMTPRASEEWSRGQFIGHTPVKQPVTLQPAPEGGAFLVWPNLDGQLELAHMGVDGEVLLDRALPLEAVKARDPQLVVGLEGRLHLLWREQSGPHAGIHYAMLEADGTPVGQPQALSDPMDRTGGPPRLARDAKGRLHALWADDAGIHWAVLDSEGGMVKEPTLVIPGGRSPLVQVDDGGRLHLVWQQEARINARSVRYAALDPEKGELGDPEEIAEILLNDRLQLEDVAFGLSEERGYVLWSEYDEGFDRYIFPYAFFSLDAPQQKQTSLWHLKVGDGPTAISSLQGQYTPLPVAISERVTGLGQELAHYLIANESAVASGEDLQLQIALITVGIEEDEPQDEIEEQIITASPRASMKPVLTIDDRSYYHLAWLETGGFGQYRLIYASTAPEVLEEYNALTLWDVLDMAFSKLFRVSLLVVAVILTFIMWAIIPLVGLAVYHVVTSEETLDTRRSRVVLVAVLMVEVALTLALPPRIAGIEAVLPALRWGVPPVTAVVAGVVTASVMRRRGDVHLFTTFFLFTILNNVLQMALFLLV